MQPLARLTFLLLLFPFAAFAQLTVSLTATGRCADDTLKAQFNDSLVTKIEWKKDGVTILTEAKNIFSAGITAAGVGVEGLTNNHVNYPRDVTVDAAGNVYVLDSLNDYEWRILKWAPNATSGTVVYHFIPNISGIPTHSLPVSLAVDVSGDVYISDGWEAVYKIVPGTYAILVAGGNSYGPGSNQLAEPGGIHIDRMGNLFIADKGNHRIQKWAPGATSGVTVAGGNGGGSGNNQLNSPVDVYVDSLGNIYGLTSHTTPRVMRWAPGATSGIRVAGGIGTGTGANQLNRPQSIAVDALGDIYIADTYNSRIQKWTAEAVTGVTVMGNGGIVSAQFDRTVAVAFDAVGNLYVADKYNHRIEKFQASFDKEYSPKTPGAFSIGLVAGNTVTNSNAVTMYPIPSATISSAGGTYLCYGNSTILSVPQTAGASYQWKFNNADLPGAVTNQLTANAAGSYKITSTLNGCSNTSPSYTITMAQPPTVSITTNNSCLGGTLQVTSSDTAIKKIEWMRNGVVVSSQERKLLSSAVTVAGGNGVGSAANQLGTPYSLTMDTNGNLYIAEGSNHRVSLWAAGSTSGVTIAGGNGTGSGLNQLAAPYDLYRTANGTLYIAEANNHRVTRWMPGATSGEKVAGDIGSGHLLNQLHTPNGIAMDEEEFLYITNAGTTGTGRVVKWREGATVGINIAGAIGNGNGASQLVSPYGMLLQKNGTIVIADGGNHRIQKWNRRETAGETIAGGNGSGAGNNQLQTPREVVTDDLGNLYISNISGHRVTKWVPGATSGETVAGTGTAGNTADKLNTPAGLYISPSGDLYVADASNHRIQKFASFINLSFTPASTGVYRAVVTFGTGCQVVTDSIEVSAVPVVTITSAMGTTICSGSSTQLTIADSTISSFQWMRNGVEVPGAITKNLTADSVGTYKVWLAKGSCSFFSDSLIVKHFDPPFSGETICAVSVDSASGKNIVMWQKTGDKRILAYKIYRETAVTNQYAAVATIGFDEMSTWIDSSANPLQQSFSYKIAVVDSCGKESALSAQHRTSHLQSNLGVSGEVNLSWSPYQGFNYGTFFIVRSLGGGPYVQIGQVSSNTFSYSDINPPTGEKRYMIQIEVPGGCSPFERSSTVSRLQSNVSTVQAGIPVVLKWIGCNTNSWLNPANWLGGVVPTAFDHVEINGAPCFQPKIPAGVTVRCRSLKVAPTVQLTVGAGSVLEVLE